MEKKIAVKDPPKIRKQIMEQILVVHPIQYLILLSK
jgi:hypothetical protein